MSTIIFGKIENIICIIESFSKLLNQYKTLFPFVREEKAMRIIKNINETIDNLYDLILEYKNNDNNHTA